MKKIIVMLFLAVALNAEVKTKETQEDCIKYLTKADELMAISVMRVDSGGMAQTTILKTISTSLAVANLQERYNICMRNAKIWKQP